MSERLPLHHLKKKLRSDAGIDGKGSTSTVDSVELDDSHRLNSEEVATKLSRSHDGKKATTDTKEALFQYKLYEILQCEDFKEILTWLPHGRSWKIIDSEALAKSVLPKYFRHSKYSSFKRQMSGWGFRRGIKVNEYNEYNHPMFIRDKPELLSKMKRRVQKRKDKAKLSAESKSNVQDSKMPASISVPVQAVSSDVVVMGNISLGTSLMNNLHETNAGRYAATIGNGAAVPMDNPLTHPFNQNLAISELSGLYANANQLSSYRNASYPLYPQGFGLLEIPQSYQTQLNFLQHNNTSDPLRMALQATSVQPSLENQSQIGYTNIQLSNYMNQLASNLISESALGQLSRFSSQVYSLPDSRSTPGLASISSNFNQLEQFARMYGQRHDVSSLATLESCLIPMLHNSNVPQQNAGTRDNNNLPIINFTNGIQGQTNRSVNNGSATLEQLRRSVLSMQSPAQNNPTNLQS